MTQSVATGSAGVQVAKIMPASRKGGRASRTARSSTETRGRGGARGEKKPNQKMAVEEGRDWEGGENL